MTDRVSTPPKVFSDAEKRLSTFLVEHGYPATVRWLLPEDVIPGGERYWINPREPESTETATHNYRCGLQKNLGINLRAVCADDSTTYATVFVPVDDLDAQNNLMGRGLKLSCPARKVKAVRITNRLRWRYLTLRYKDRIRDFRGSAVPSNCW